MAYFNISIQQPLCVTAECVWLIYWAASLVFIVYFPLNPWHLESHRIYPGPFCNFPTDLREISRSRDKLVKHQSTFGELRGNLIVDAPQRMTGNTFGMLWLWHLLVVWPLFPSSLDSINTNLRSINNSLLAYDFISLGSLKESVWLGFDFCGVAQRIILHL